MSTFSARPADIKKKWVLIDAEGLVVGRLASHIAMRLRGKHLPIVTPHMDTGDNVIVINADKVKFTGNKLADKKYYHHTGHPGGIKEVTAGKLLGGKHPERVVEKAVERMMPKESPLARRQLAKLHVYAGADHKHAAQQPVVVDFKGANRKNSRIG